MSKAWAGAATAAAAAANVQAAHTLQACCHTGTAISFKLRVETKKTQSMITLM
jgi:hypothetical protein